MRRSLSLTFVATQDERFRLIFDVLDDIDQVGDFREERIVVGKSMNLFMVIARSPDVQSRLDVRVYESATVSKNF